MLLPSKQARITLALLRLMGLPGAGEIMNAANSAITPVSKKFTYQFRFMD
jgi:hypothetical protein